MTNHIAVSDIPEGHVIIGHIVNVKVMDPEGEIYYSRRYSGDLSDMEKYGMAMSHVDDMRRMLADND